MTTYHLTPCAPTQWNQVCSLEGFAGWYYCDTDGAHLADSPPADLPLSTHVWAWGIGQWGRWRIDPVSGTVIGAVLTSAAAPETPGTQVAVTASKSEFTAWGSGNPSVGLTGSLRDRTVRILAVDQPSPLQFLEISPSKDSE